MKGLVTKSIYSIYRKNEKLIIMMLLVNALFMTMFSSFSFLSIFTMFFAAALVQDQIWEDNKNSFSTYESVLPITRQNTVYSRYISAFIFIMLSAAASILATAFIDFMFDYDIELMSFVLTSLLFAYISFIILCILFPIYYRYGTKHIRIVSILLLVLPTALNYLATLPDIPVFDITFEIYQIIILSVVSLLIIAASIYLSLNIRGKD